MKYFYNEASKTIVTTNMLIDIERLKKAGYRETNEVYASCVLHDVDKFRYCDTNEALN